MARIGLISDTHGLLRPQVLDYLKGSDAIVHAGDICEPGVLEQLAKLAPLTAVRGNNDVGSWADRLRETELLRVGEVGIFVIHDLSQLDLPSDEDGVRVVVSGHSHKPLVQQRGAILFVNPGSAGPRRFQLPIAAGELLVGGSAVQAHIREFQA